MPRLIPELEHCAFFLCDPRTGEPGGTGFIVGRETTNHRHYYAITNKHVFADYPWPRVNKRSGGARYVELDPALDWIFNPDGPDIAAADITELLEDGDLVRSFGELIFATPDHIERGNIGMGDEIVMIGLFANHFGNAKRGNAPAGRFGNISQMADARHKLRLNTDTQPWAYHLVDLRSRTGFSGSPVFVYRTPATNLACIDPDGGWTLATGGNLFLLMLGIHCGQFMDEIKPMKVQKRVEAEVLGEPIRDGDILEVPGSMTCVLPAPHISALLDHPKLEQRRLARATS